MAKKAKDIQYYEATGRRKESVARVRLYIADKTKGVMVAGKKIIPGQILVNTYNLTDVFAREVEQKKCIAPLELTNSVERFAISILIRGGGRNGQIDAIRHGLAKALVLADEDAYKLILREHSLITRDPRARERRKVGTGGKARRQKQSPKR